MAKKKKEPKKRNKVASTLNVSGDKVERKNKSCPKCGEGFFMAKHKDRSTCGKCGYMEK
jgi:ubiquitin-small subunit ribosomal protein S27Ae